MGPAPTIRLASSPATGAVKPTGAPTVPLRPVGAGTPTIALPKATVQLQPPTQPLGTSFTSTPQLSTVQAEDDDEEDAGEGVIKILSGVGLAAAVLVLVFQLMAANTWINVEDNPNKDEGWMQLMN
jgi:hypothetical protein